LSQPVRSIMRDKNVNTRMAFLAGPLIVVAFFENVIPIMYVASPRRINRANMLSVSGEIVTNTALHVPVNVIRDSFGGENRIRHQNGSSDPRYHIHPSERTTEQPSTVNNVEDDTDTSGDISHNQPCDDENPQEKFSHGSNASPESNTDACTQRP
jgi:hypothetical protein